MIAGEAMSLVLWSERVGHWGRVGVTSASRGGCKITEVTEPVQAVSRDAEN